MRQMEIEALRDQTIEEATIKESPAGDEELHLKLTDGRVFVVGAWRRDGYGTEMMVEQVS